MSPTSDNPVRRVLRWLRAGRPDGVAPGDYVAVVAVLNRDLTEAQAEEVAQALLEEGPYDDELITEDEIRAMIDERVHEEATEDDIARIAHLLEEAGVNVDPHVPGAAH